MRKIAEDLIEKADLPKSYFDKYPSELSSGRQQRISVIRALAAHQNIILMDDPFGFSNTYAFMVREYFANEHKLEKISDFEKLKDEVSVGVDTG